MKIAEAYIQSLLTQEDALGAVLTLSGFWSPRADAAKPMLGLSRSECLCQLVLIYAGEVGNGGHFQFFDNRGFETIDDHVAALEAVSLPSLAKVLREAVKVQNDDEALDVLDREAWRRFPEVYRALQIFLRKTSDDVLKPERS